MGYIRAGCFNLLFSAGCLSDERRPGIDVPLNFEQLDVGPVVNLQPQPPGYLSTNSIRGNRIRLTPQVPPPSTPSSRIVSNSPSTSLLSTILSSPQQPPQLSPPTSSCVRSVASASFDISQLYFSMLEPGSTVSLRLLGEQGAALVTRYQTYREDAQRLGVFAKYAKSTTPPGRRSHVTPDTAMTLTRFWSLGSTEPEISR